MLECDIEDIQYYENLMVYGRRIVCGYCTCKCGTLQFVSFKG